MELNMSQKSPLKLHDHFRLRIRSLHYSRRTEETYWHWIKRFIVFHGKRHPSLLGRAEAEAFLSSLATDRNVAANTQNLALRSEEHTSELQSLMRISYAVFCLKTKNSKVLQSQHL